MSSRRRTTDVPAADESARTRAAALFDTHFDSVYRYCVSRTADPTIAEDAAAQTFYEAARSLAARPDTPIDRRWLFVVAKRRVVDGWRRQERQRRVARRVELHIVDEHPTDGSGRVVRALASLPERQRRAVVLRYLDEQSVAEVADELGVTYPAAESLLARGRRSFERAFREASDD